MKRDDLKAMGLEDGVIDKIMAENGKDIEKFKSEAATAKTTAETVQAQLAETAKQIEAFKGMDIEGVKKSADEWKTKAEQAEAARVADISKLRFDTALDKALAQAKVKDTVSVRAHLKIDGMKLDEDGSILGLDKQLEAIKSTKDFLFEAEGQTPKLVTGGNNQTVLTDSVVDAARKAAGLKP